MVPVVAGVPSERSLAGGAWSIFPGIEFDGPLPPAEPYFSIGPAFWKRPKNWKQLVDAVAWASQGDVPLQVFGPDYLANESGGAAGKAAETRSSGELQPQAGSIDREH